MSEGLRDRKKRQTREKISAVATRLFVERGFDHVTIAEVAEAAEVSVNTVYNYFQVKEDLVLPPESPERLADIVRARAPGVSAARAVLDRLRQEIVGRERQVGLSPGFGPVLEMMRAAPTLSARLGELAQEMVERLAAALAAETGSADAVSRAVAWQLGSVHTLVYSEIGRRVSAGSSPDEVATEVLELLDAVEGLLGAGLLGYAVREG